MMFFFIFSLFYVFFSVFNRKFLAILCLEALMIFMIFGYYTYFFNLNSSAFLGLLIFCIFMVLDSVLGISNLVNSFRLSTNLSVLSNFF